MAWLLSLLALAIVGFHTVLSVEDEYDNKSSDIQLNAIIWAIILNIVAFIVNGMYFSVVI